MNPFKRSCESIPFLPASESSRNFCCRHAVARSGVVCSTYSPVTGFASNSNDKNPVLPPLPLFFGVSYSFLSYSFLSNVVTDPLTSLSRLKSSTRGPPQ